MTKAQKKLQIEMSGIGREQTSALTGLSVTALYSYVRSEEQSQGMKLKTAVIFYNKLGIELMEWFEDYQDTYGVNTPRSSQSTDSSQRFFEPK